MSNIIITACIHICECFLICMYVRVSFNTTIDLKNVSVRVEINMK